MKKHSEDIIVITNLDRIADEIINTLPPKDNYNFIRAMDISDGISKMTFQVPCLVIIFIEDEDSNIVHIISSLRKSIKNALVPFIIISPVERPSFKIEAIEAGVDTFLSYPYAPEELVANVHSILNRFKEFYRISITDELTKLANRKEFIKNINMEIKTRPNDKMSLVIIDIDNFKKINDLYGHQVGDDVLMKFGKLLIDKKSDTFLPARFGGEEFIILMPETEVHKAQEIMNLILKQLSEINFKHQKRSFIVSFSGGIAEYPTMAHNVSELLSRADQALYAAKESGKSRVYIFTPLMARNDIFWEHMKFKQSIYVNEQSYNSETGLPYLPQLLQTISDLDFPTNSIGILIISVLPVYDLKNYIGYNNVLYDIENIQFIITKSTEFLFPSDTYIGLSDFFNFEFIIMFPSYVDFTFNSNKFNTICSEICELISNQLISFNLELSYSNTISNIDKTEPRKIIDTIEKSRQSQAKIEPNKGLLKSYINSIKKPVPDTIHLTLKHFYKHKTPAYHYISFEKPYTIQNYFYAYLIDSKMTPKKMNALFARIADTFKDQIDNPLLLPYLTRLSFEKQLSLLDQHFNNKQVTLLISEHDIKRIGHEQLKMLFNILPENIKIGIDNCFIGSSLLSYLSQYNFSLVVLSENIIRNIHYFKDRIKVLSGLKLFLDQLTIPMLAKNILCKEEYYILNDLGLHFFSGDYPDIIHSSSN